MTVTAQEKQGLVNELVDNALFAKAPRARALLIFLLKKHLENADLGPTQSEILEALGDAEEISFQEKTDAVRSQVNRLRDMIARYFKAEGTAQALRLTILSGGERGYRLSFERKSDRAPLVRDWFWRAYEDSWSKETQIGYISEAKDQDEGKKAYPRSQERYWSATILHHFADLFGSAKLRILEPGWEHNDNGYLNYTDRSSILIGDRECLVDGGLGFLDEIGDYFQEYRWLYSERFLLSVVQRKGKTIFLNPDGDPTSVVDSETTEHVLLTRLTTDHWTEQTLLIGQSLASIEKVCLYITSETGLLQIEAHPKLRDRVAELRKAWEQPKVYYDGGRSMPQPIFYRGGVPNEFQILFAVSTSRRTNFDAKGKLDDVKIELCVVPPIATWPKYG